MKKKEEFATIEVLITLPYGEKIYEKMEVRSDYEKYDAIRQAKEIHGCYAYVRWLRKTR